MKKRIITIVLAILFGATETNAQVHSTKFFQEITGGIIISKVASYYFLKDTSELAANFFLNAAFFTRFKTFHHFRYGVGDSSLRTQNGYLLPKDLDVYVIYSKNLKNGGNYFACGAEKMIEVKTKKEK